MSRFPKKIKSSNETGLALIWVLMVVAVTSALSLAFLQKVSIGISTTGTRSNSIQAQYLAEAAANHALWRLLNQETFPVASDVYYMHSLGNGRYGYKVRRHTKTTFATVAVVGGVGDTVVRQSYVIYVKGGWYDSAWKYRQKISISPNVTDSDLTDFPYMVNISDAANGLFMNAQLDGDDIIFTDDESTTKLDHELEKYVSLDLSEELVAWVKLPLLSSSAATDIYMYYGNHPVANQENAVAVWSNNYESVYHLHDGIDDSVGNHGGTFEDTDDVTGGPIAGAQDFVPLDYISIGTWYLGLINTFTIQAWIKSDDGFAQNYPRAISKARGTSNEDHVWMMSLYPGNIGNNRLRFRLKTGLQDWTGTTVLYGSNPNGYLPDANQWYLVAMTYDGSQMSIIRDGLDAGSTGDSGAIRTNDWPIQIGNNPYSTATTSNSWDGKIDEVRISTVDRSIDWMRAEYRNQGSPATYQSLQNEESRHLGGAILTEANFDSDDEGFVFLPDIFRSTSQAAYASGDYIAAGGYAGGALRVVLGGINDNIILGMSGGWRQTFDLAADSDVSISFVYKLTLAANYESDEFGQALVSVDGTLYGEGEWWNTAWLDRTQITFDNTNSAENLTDFPVLVTLTAADVDFDKIKAGGADIRFVDSDGTQLNHEIEAWDDGAETAKVWVKVPQINAGSNTDYIHLYYNNNTGASDAQNAAAVWPAGIGVWHLAEDPAPGGAGDIKDSDGSANDGTAETSMSPADLVTGRIGNAIDFDGANDYIDFAWTDVGNTFTIEAWIKPDSSGTGIQTIVANSPSGAQTDGFRFFINTNGTEDGKIIFETGNGTASAGVLSAAGVINFDQWNHVAVEVDRAGGSGTIYHNGVDVTVGGGARTDFDTGSGWEIGRMEGSLEFKGVIDELRISNVARSADWIEASFLSQNGTFAFNTFGAAGAGDTVAQINGDGNGGSAISTGWKRFHVDLGTLTAGTHTLIIGGYNNQKTFNDESTEIIIDDVIIRQ